MKTRNPVTPEDALLFDGFIAKWQTKLNLNDWRIERGLLPAKNAMASVEFNEPARLATYRLGDFGAEVITPESLEKTALHELLHVVFHDVLNASLGRFEADHIEAAEHRVINLFEKLLLQDNYALTAKCAGKGAND